MPDLVLWTAAQSNMLEKYVTPVIRRLGISYRVQQITGKLPKLKEGEVCIGFGQRAVEVLQAVELVPKNRKVGSLRGTEIKLRGGKISIFLTFDPGFVEMDYARKPDVAWDINLAIRKLTTRSTDPVYGDYRYVKDFYDVINEIKVRFKERNEPVPICCDLETVGLDPWAKGAFIVSISISYKKGQADVIRFKSAKSPRQPARWLTKDEPDINKQQHEILNELLLDQITWLMNSKKVIVRGANFKFDQTWMGTHWGVEYFDSFKMDTLLTGSLVDENRSNSLNTHTKIYCVDGGGYDDAFNKTFDKSRMDLVPDEPLLLYAGGDTDYGLQCSKIIKRELTSNKKLTRFYTKLQHPAAQAFRIMEQRGMYVDKERYLELQQEIQEELDTRHAELVSLLPAKTRVKYKDDLRITRPKIIRDFLFSKKGLNLKPLQVTDKKEEPKTNVEHYEELLKKHPKKTELKKFVDTMRAYTSAKKTMDTYVIGFMKHLRTDGKFHPTHLLHRGEYDGDDGGATSGRLSAKAPAVQTIPKKTKWAKKLRSVFIAPPGHVVMNVDFQQGELRVIACVANEPTMLKAYREGKDLHAMTAAEVNSMSFSEFMKQPKDIISGQRSSGKAGNFGMIYGISPEGFQSYAKTSYGVILSLRDSQDFRDKFFKLYPRLLDYHAYAKRFAHKYGYVISPLGRVRHLPLINSRDYSVRGKSERIAINSPIQSTLSDLTLLATAILSEKYPELYIMGMTHDSLSFYIPENEVIEWAYRIREVMENLPIKEYFGWSPQIPFLIDVEVGQEHMGDMEELILDR